MSKQQTDVPRESSGYSRPSSNAWASTKLQAHHQDRLAFVYVRQSNPQQVLDHQESTARQYALVDLAIELGWSPDQVEVIDEDQGHSGSTAEGRYGFHRLLAEVGLDHVGIILGIELSRLARCNKDWHQLIELCGIFRTLLADQDGLYDPTDYNDRLLLGLRGMMSEAELHIMQGRMYQAILNKARRGDLYILAPIGYVKLPTGELGIDPDEQARNVIHLVFDAFDRRGTIRGVIRYLVEHSVMMPVRPHSGPNRGQLEWRRPTRDTVNTILTHPLFAGTYRYGHRQLDPRRRQPGKPHSGRVVVDPDDYHALIPGRCPAYISIERYERNQRRIAQNQVRFSAKGPPREGGALLGGLVFCGHCDTRMSVHYGKDKGTFQYTCRARINDCHGPTCQSVSGRVLDELVAEKILAALQPAALELSLSAADDLQQERRRLEQTWQHRLERARYDAERAERQYQAVEPENRLVARTLEQQWESALSELEAVQREYARFRQSHSSSLTEDEREAIRELSKDLPAVWNASATSAADRQRIVQILLNRILVTVQDSTERVDVTLHWAGGFTSQHELIRPVRRYDQLADYERLIGRIKELRREGVSFAGIAEQLNRDGFRPAKQAEKFHSDLVSNLFRRHVGGQPGPRSRLPSLVLEEDEWLAIDLAPCIGIAKNTLLSWIKRGWVHVSRRLPGYHGRVICWVDAEELKRLRRLRETNHNWRDQPLPAELTTPKAPPKK